jgi:hypothetical protein
MKILKAKYQGYMYHGTEGNASNCMVYVDTANPSPDPGKLMLWGKTLTRETVSDFKDLFERVKGHILEFEYREGFTALQTKQSKANQLDRELIDLIS